MNAKDVLGRHGEDLAAQYLQQTGLRVIDRNWRCADGEIDIVAVDRRVLVVCEVKTRTGDRFGAPLESISKAKLRRLRRLAIRWVVAHGVLFDEIRVDAVGVLRSPSGEFTVDYARGVG
jgi:putative endonuclease